MKYTFRLKKLQLEDIFPLLVATVLITLIFTIAFFAFRKQEPIPSPSTIPTTAPQPTRAIPFTKVYSPIYNRRSQDLLMQKIENRVPLSEKDIAAKNKLLSFLPADKGSGVLHETETIRIDYTKGPDLFQVEIRSVNINSAKEEGKNWFLSQGMSQQGICDLPVDFYLHWEVIEQLRDKVISFSPLATGCE